MRATKFAISVPAETMGHVDRAAKRLHMTRSRYISVVLARIAQRGRNAATSKRIDDVLAQLDEQDLDTARYLGAARSDKGPEW